MISTAGTEHVDGILQIQKEHLISNTTNPSTGVLVGEKSRKTVREYIQKSTHEAFVYTEKDEVQGYVLSAPRFTGVRAPEDVIGELERFYTDSNLVQSLVHIAVSESSKGTDVSDKLYNRFLEEYEDEKLLVGEIAEVNNASQRFFSRKGWQPVSKKYRWDNKTIDWKLWYYR